jgi:L-ribulose-5-phosphate 3-epimerase
MNRRDFVQMASATSLALALQSTGWGKSAPVSAGRVGMYIHLEEPDATMKTVKSLGMSVCEIYNENLDMEVAEKVAAAAFRQGIRIAAMITLGPGDTVWDFYDGPWTIGLVPRQWRQKRVEHMKRASDFAKKAGIPAIETHVGFIPETPKDPLYRETVTALQEVVAYCKGNGQQFFYHAGQETPVTLLRTMTDVGLDNQRVGLDTANPVMYGKGNPVDSVEVLGKHLGLVNFKDGLWPVNGKDLGSETPIPKGKVDFPRLVWKLKEVGYQGPMIIEREISGPQLIADVRAGRDYIEELLGHP